MLIAQKIEQGYAQYVAQCKGYRQPMRPSLTQLIARNLESAMNHAADLEQIASERDLADKAGVAPNTIGNMLRPGKRLPTSKREASPQIASVERVAKALKLQPLALLLDEFDPKDRRFHADRVVMLWPFSADPADYQQLHLTDQARLDGKVTEFIEERRGRGEANGGKPVAMKPAAR